jgi:CubicO group peptidase (beta-lactamase class C family)
MDKSERILWATDDMHLWNRSLLKATLLSRETLQEMFAVPTAAGPAHTHYASGWFVEPGGVIWHAGRLVGYGTNNMLVPATGYAITLLSNTRRMIIGNPDVVIAL